MVEGRLLRERLRAWWASRLLHSRTRTITNRQRHLLLERCMRWWVHRAGFESRRRQRAWRDGLQAWHAYTLSRSLAQLSVHTAREHYRGTQLRRLLSACQAWRAEVSEVRAMRERAEGWARRRQAEGGWRAWRAAVERQRRARQAREAAELWRRQRGRRAALLTLLLVARERRGRRRTVQLARELVRGRALGLLRRVLGGWSSHVQDRKRLRQAASQVQSRRERRLRREGLWCWREAFEKAEEEREVEQQAAEWRRGRQALAALALLAMWALHRRRAKVRRAKALWLVRAMAVRRWRRRHAQATDRRRRAQAGMTRAGQHWERAVSLNKVGRHHLNPQHRTATARWSSSSLHPPACRCRPCPAWWCGGGRGGCWAGGGWRELPASDWHGAGTGRTSPPLLPCCCSVHDSPHAA